MSASPRARTSFQLMPAARSWPIRSWRIQPSQLRGPRHSRASACLPALSQSPYPNFSSHAEESFVTQFRASASVAKPGTSISGRSGNLTMTSHPDPVFMGRGSNLILATDLANGGLRARRPWISLATPRSMCTRWVKRGRVFVSLNPPGIPKLKGSRHRDVPVFHLVRPASIE
jgi:hypothetical protein